MTVQIIPHVRIRTVGADFHMKFVACTKDNPSDRMFKGFIRLCVFLLVFICFEMLVPWLFDCETRKLFLVLYTDPVVEQTTG